jgi:hypothetical protein
MDEIREKIRRYIDEKFSHGKVPPLVDAVERNLTAEQFLEIYKATPLEHLSEAIKQYRQAV